MGDLNNPNSFTKKESLIIKIVRFFDVYARYLFWKISELKLGVSFYLLFLANLAVMIILGHKDLYFQTLFFIFWCQSTIIGIFFLIKILKSKHLSTEYFKTKQIPTDEPSKTSLYTAIFFLFHYELFHLAYLLFIIGKFNLNPEFFFVTFFAIGLFLLVHLYSFFKNFKADTEREQSVGRAMFFPYARILPMHAIIILGFFILNTKRIIFFVFLKTIADLIMHYIEHRGNGANDSIDFKGIFEFFKGKIELIKLKISLNKKLRKI
jgi:hypothetical protein